jgi:hypothetical protein
LRLSDIEAPLKLSDEMRFPPPPAQWPLALPIRMYEDFDDSVPYVCIVHETDHLERQWRRYSVQFHYQGRYLTVEHIATHQLLTLMDPSIDFKKFMGDMLREKIEELKDQVDADIAYEEACGR